MVGQQRHGHGGIGQSFWDIIQVVSRMPKGLSWVPACQMETFSAFQVSTGPTVAARVGASDTCPPPQVRAFWITVMGCRSVTRVGSF